MPVSNGMRDATGPGDDLPFAFGRGTACMLSAFCRDDVERVLRVDIAHSGVSQCQSELTGRPWLRTS
jgi:hypothetical protein